MSGVWHESDASSEEEPNNENGNIENGVLRKIRVDEPQSSGTNTVARRSLQSNVNPEADGGGMEVNFSERTDGHTAKWLAGTWPLKQFDGNLPLNKRKAEWIRFRDQFERIVACKQPVGPAMKLTGMKIFAGDYLLSVIEMEEKAAGKSDDSYAATIARLNR